MLTFFMHRSLVKFVADFGPLLVFFIIYFNNENDLKIAIPPFIIATLISLVVIYLLEKMLIISVYILGLKIFQPPPN